MNGRIVLEKEKKAQGLFIEKRKSPAGSVYPLHWHDYYELEYIVSGSVRHVCNGGCYHVGAGDVYLMSYYDHHALEVLEDMEMIHISFDENFLDPSLSLDSYGFLGGHLLREEAGREFLSHCDALLREQDDRDVCFETVQRARLTEMLILLIRHSQRGQSLPPQTVQCAVAHIHKHFQKQLSLESMARAIGMSPNHLGMRFRQTMGASFHDYLNQVRLKYACGMLASTEKPVKEIALSCGYNSVEYFFYVFRKTLGMTPIQYRKMI